MRINGHRALIAAGAAAVIAGSTGMIGGQTATAGSTPAITFGTPTIVDPVHGWGEPKVDVNPSDNTVYDSGPQGTGVQRSGWEGSVDGGSTFRIVGQCPAPTAVNTVSTDSCPLTLPPNAAAGQIPASSAPGGGDSEQKFNYDGKQFFADLYALACQRVAITTNDGATAPENAFGCGQQDPACTGSSGTSPCPGEGSDRQWLAVLDPRFLPGHPTQLPDPATAPDGEYYKFSTQSPSLTYMEYNNLNTVQNNCSDWFMSTDGLNYSPANNTTVGNFGCDGYPSVDQHTGQIFEASTCNPGICLNIGQPLSSGYMCFLDTPSSDTNCAAAYGPGYKGGNAAGHALITVAGTHAANAGTLFVVSSMDSGQNLHVSWIEGGNSDTNPPSGDDWQAYTTIASRASGWTTWAAPVQLSSGTVNIFPWVQASDGPACEATATAEAECAGRSDTTWYGTTDTSEGPSSPTPGKQVWNVYMNQVVWPIDSSGQWTGAAPVSTTLLKVSPHPMQYGEVCLLGTGCITQQGNRNVADFFDVTVDRNGAAVVSYDDNSNNLLQNGAPSNVQAADHAGAPIITIARQTAGPGLFAGLGGSYASLTGANPGDAAHPYEPATPTTGMTDDTGDARYPVIGGTNVPALDLTSNALSLASNNSTLTVTMHASDLSSTGISNAFTAVPGSTALTYVTRWLEPSNAGQGTCSPGNTVITATACTLFYAMAEVTPATVVGGSPTVVAAAGEAQSIDLCSVSACFPHDIYYPEAGPGVTTLSGGQVNFDQSTNTITLTVPASAIGSPTQTTELEEVGTYTLASDHLQAAITNANAQTDDVPIEVDGLCCFNFQAQVPANSVPEFPWTPGVIVIGSALIGAGLIAERRRRTRSRSN